jgi:hypothetical protein
MASLKTFVSSTCYDLPIIRAQLRSLLISLGHEPVMSDQADVLFDPRLHTHTSCLREVENCDVVVLIIGSRFGGTTVPKALESIDVERLSDLSRADRFPIDKARISITQAEVLQSIQLNIPVFAFVDSGVMRDHLTYEKNKNKPIIKEIDFSSIEKSETAAYIFEFINFLRLRSENNSIFEFSRFEDIENQLKRQWSMLFQRLLHEQRSKSQEERRIDNLSSQIADLKAAILSSISNTELKETAKGAIRFRHLIDFIFSLVAEYRPGEPMELLRADIPWDTLMKQIGIIEIRPDDSRDRIPSGAILIRDDGTYYRARTSIRAVSRMAGEWEGFRHLGPEAKEAIINAVLDTRESRPMFLVRHYNEPYIAELIEDSEDEGVTEKPQEAARVVIDNTKPPRLTPHSTRRLDSVAFNILPRSVD